MYPPLYSKDNSSTVHICRVAWLAVDRVWQNQAQSTGMLPELVSYKQGHMEKKHKNNGYTSRDKLKDIKASSNNEKQREINK